MTRAGVVLALIALVAATALLAAVLRWLRYATP